jgi:hypothetical protein
MAVPAFDQRVVAFAADAYAGIPCAHRPGVMRRGDGDGEQVVVR